MIRIDAWRQNLKLLEANIQAVLKEAGRNRSSLRVVIATKSHSADIIEELFDLDVSEIGESYVQEALNKMQLLNNNHANVSEANWHMIGHVQSRKAKDVAANFDWVHSVDSLKLATRLNRAAQALNKRLNVLVQVNISGEASKFGFAAKLEEDKENLLETMHKISTLSNLDTLGLMSIPPFDQEKRIANEIYLKTVELRDYLESGLGGKSLPELSMGMSNDYSEAILAGATIIRVGSAVLGPREK